MHRSRVVGAMSLLCLSLAAGSAPASPAAALKGMPLSFVQNQGQTEPSTRFQVSGPAGSLALQSDGIRLAIPVPHTAQPTADLVRIRFAGARPDPSPTGIGPQAIHTNFISGNDPSKWLLDVPTFAQTRYKGLYPGTDLLCYGTNGKLEYDWILQPGADPSCIRVAFEGATSLKVDTQGNLIARTPHGELVQAPPVAYQTIDGQKVRVQAKFHIDRGKQVGFTLGRYDRTRELVIDPVLAYVQTLSSGSAPSDGAPFAFDNPGGVALGNFGDPTIAWSDYDLSGGVATPHVHVSRLTGSSPYASTFGGTAGASSSVTGIAIDGSSSGNAYITGNTTDTAFPHDIGSVSNSTPYVLKLDTAGTKSYSTLFGGPSDAAFTTVATGIAVDPALQSAYVTGSTTANDFPTTAGAYKTAHTDDSVNNGGFSGTTLGYDSFVVKFNTVGGVSYSTYLGGDDWDQALAIAVDSSGDAYITGQTYSSNLATSGTLQTTHGADSYDVGGGVFLFNYDAFVAKLNSTGSALTWCTYLGGNGVDAGRSIALDGLGNVVVGLTTGSTDLSTSSGAYQSARSGSAGDDAFIAKLDDFSGKFLTMGTYLGGGAEDTVDHIAVDKQNNVYVAGTTLSANFPSVHQLYSYDTTNGSPYLARVAKDGKSLLFATSLSDGTTNTLPTGTGSSVGITGLAINTNSGDANEYGTAYVASADGFSGEAKMVMAKLQNGTPSVTAAQGDLPTLIQEGATLTVNYSDLLATSGADDGDGDPIVFVFNQDFSGQTKKGGVAATGGVTTLSSGEQWTWTPSAPGRPINAFAVYATDGFHATGTSSGFLFNVNVNAKPTVSSITDKSYEAGDTTPFNVSFTASDAETAVGSLAFTVTSSDTTLVPNANLSVSNSSGNCTLHITPASTTTLGSSNISVQVSDTDGGSRTQTFKFSVVDTTAPDAGTPSATGTSGSITLADSTASDVVGVTKVELYIDGNLAASANAATISSAFDSTTLTDGNHTLVAKAYDSSSNVGASSGVTFSVDNHAPSISVSVTGVKGTITLNASATDTVGVTNTEWYIDGSLAGSSASSSITYNSALLTDGNHTLVGKAYDAAGNVGTSSSASFTVDNNPATTSASVTGSSGTITLNATAVDTVGVNRVGFYIDGVWVGTDTTSAYSFTVDSTKLVNGTHTLVAKSVDLAGNIGVSAPASFTINNSAVDTAPPTNITCAVTGSSGTLTFTGSAQDNNGISRLGYYVDGAWVASSSIKPTFDATFDSTGLANGSHTLKAYAVDFAGNSAASAPVTFTVSNVASDTTAPVVSSLTVTGTTGSITFQATATDNVKVAKVAYLVDGKQVAALTTPYTYQFNSVPLVNGTHTLQAVAYDLAGNTGSTSISFSTSN